MMVHVHNKFDRFTLKLELLIFEKKQSIKLFEMIFGEFIFDHNRYKVDTNTIILTHTRAASVTDLNYRDHDGYIILLPFLFNLLTIVFMHIQIFNHFLWQVDTNFLN